MYVCPCIGAARASAISSAMARSSAFGSRLAPFPARLRMRNPSSRFRRDPVGDDPGFRDVQEGVRPRGKRLLERPNAPPILVNCSVFVAQQVLDVGGDPHGRSSQVLPLQSLQRFALIPIRKLVRNDHGTNRPAPSRREVSRGGGLGGGGGGRFPQLLHRLRA